MTPHVDDAAAGGRRAVARAREDALVSRLAGLGTTLDGEPDAEYRARARARLVAMAAVRSPAPPHPSRLRRLLSDRPDAGVRGHRRTRLTAALAGAALTVTTLAVLVAVATGARPGDVLYGLKRGTEQTRLALAGDSRGETLLDLASTRLGELQDLVGGQASALSGGGPAAAGAPTSLIVSTLRTMNEETTAGAAWLTRQAAQSGDSASLHDLATWVGHQSTGFAALRPAIPDGAQEPAEQAGDLLTAIGGRAAALVPAVDCAAGPSTQGSDELGPLPAPCPVAAPSASSSRTGSSPGKGRPAGGAGAETSAPAPGSVVPPSPAGTGTVQTSPGSAGSAPGLPSLGGGSSTAGSGAHGGIGGLPVPSPLPSVPALPTGGSLIHVPLPGPPPSGSPSASGGQPGIGVCLPPLVTVGSC